MESKLIKNQQKQFRKGIKYDGQNAAIVVTVRHDDSCNNGHNTFAITGSITINDKRDSEVAGCIHEEIAKHFQELAHLIRFHLFDTKGGPMHYLANTIYHASERDHWGLLKGEFRQHTSRGKYQADGVEGIPGWKLEVTGMPEDWNWETTYSKDKPAPPMVKAEWVPDGITGEGKPRNLAAARACAAWPEATDEDLTAPGLEERLKARLPKLMQEFRQAVEGLGMTF